MHGWRRTLIDMTDQSHLFDAGVKEYRESYWRPEYQPGDTDILTAFRVTPQEGVPIEEAAAAVAAESSTGTWTQVWTDHLVDIARYQAKAYRIDPVAGEPDQVIAYIAYPLVQAPDANADAQSFAKLLCGADGQAVLARYGFLPP